MRPAPRRSIRASTSDWTSAFDFRKLTPLVQRQLPALTGGEGVLESDFGGYRPLSGAAPTRRRTMANPLYRDEYFLRVTRRV